LRAAREDWIHVHRIKITGQLGEAALIFDGERSCRQYLRGHFVLQFGSMLLFSLARLGLGVEEHQLQTRTL
jgi:hypothetical protein